MAHIAKRGRTNAVYSAIVKLTPISERGNDHATFDVVCDARHTFKRTS